jgi:phage terminase large subunit GpA-like protein
VNGEQLFSDWLKLWEPPKRLTLSQWAEEHFYTSSEYSSVTKRLRLHGYQREPFDCFTDPRVSTIVVKSGTQMLKTLLMQVALAYVASEDPGPCLLSQAKEDDAAAFSKERITPMIRDIPKLQAIPGLALKSRTAGSTATYKEFPGGSWSFVGAGTAGNAARRSIRFGFFDEINKYELTKEGLFTDLAIERMATFGTRAKAVFCCSPTTPDGLISVMYEESDKRKPWVPCPDCGEFQILVWTQVRWDSTLPREDQPVSAHYVCEHCNSQWDDTKRIDAAATENILWIAEKPFRGIAGFGGLGHLYSPYKTLAGMVAEWLRIADDKSENAPERRRKFINTNLAEEYIEKGESPEWRRLYDRSRKSYPQGVVPEGGLFLTAGSDVQKDRIEIYVYAWGRGKRSWCIDQVILEGDTTRPEIWQKLSAYLSQTYQHESGVDMPIVRFAIDSAYVTQDVYAWVRKQGPHVIAIRGVDDGPIIGTPTHQEVNYAGKKIQRGIKLWPLNVWQLKSEFYGWLNLDGPTDAEFINGAEFPPGYCFFPALDEEFFKQLTSEQLVTHVVKGKRKTEWIRAHRNEALDCRNYARAAASQCGMDRRDRDDAWWRSLEAAIRETPRAVISPAQEKLAVSAPVQQSLQHPRRPRPQIRLGGF